MSETGATVTANPRGRMRLGTVGLAEPGYSVQLAADGEILVRGPSVMARYRNDPDRTAEAFDPNGWLRTGDLVTIKDDRVHFVGRCDTQLSVGGAKVTPEEVEHMLLQAPGVLDARVFGIPNVITGSVVAAEIVTKATDHDSFRRAIITHLTGRLEPHKVPRIIRFVQSLQLSQSGKKRRLDEQG